MIHWEEWSSHVSGDQNTSDLTLENELVQQVGISQPGLPGNQSTPNPRNGFSLHSSVVCELADMREQLRVLFQNLQKEEWIPPANWVQRHTTHWTASCLWNIVMLEESQTMTTTTLNKRKDHSFGSSLHHWCLCLTLSNETHVTNW